MLAALMRLKTVRLYVPTLAAPSDWHACLFFLAKVVWVTGADHGLGEQLAINLAVNGARVSYRAGFRCDSENRSENRSASSGQKIHPSPSRYLEPPRQASRTDGVCIHSGVNTGRWVWGPHRRCARCTTTIALKASLSNPYRLVSPRFSFPACLLLSLFAYTAGCMF